jgi:hypothetical protein
VAVAILQQLISFIMPGSKSRLKKLLRQDGSGKMPEYVIVKDHLVLNIYQVLAHAKNYRGVERDEISVASQDFDSAAKHWRTVVDRNRLKKHRLKKRAEDLVPTLRLHYEKLFSELSSARIPVDDDEGEDLVLLSEWDEEAEVYEDAPPFADNDETPNENVAATSTASSWREFLVASHRDEQFPHAESRTEEEVMLMAVNAGEDIHDEECDSSLSTAVDKRSVRP